MSQAAICLPLQNTPGEYAREAVGIRTMRAGGAGMIELTSDGQKSCRLDGRAPTVLDGRRGMKRNPHSQHVATPEPDARQELCRLCPRGYRRAAFSSLAMRPACSSRNMGKVQETNSEKSPRRGPGETRNTKPPFLELFMVRINLRHGAAPRENSGDCGTLSFDKHGWKKEGDGAVGKAPVPGDSHSSCVFRRPPRSGVLRLAKSGRRGIPNGPACTCCGPLRTKSKNKFRP